MTVKNTESREYLTRTADIIRIVRYAVLILLVIFILLTSIIGRSYLKPENFRYLFKYFTADSPSSSSGYSDIEFSTGENPRITVFKGDVAVLDGGILSIFGSDGKAAFTEDTDGMTEISRHGRYLALYTPGGKELALYNSFSKVFGVSFEERLLFVRVGDDGSFVAVTESESGRVTASVYNRYFRLAYTWITYDKNVCAAEISPDGRCLAVLAYYYDNGSCVSVLTIRDMYDDTGVCSLTYVNRVPSDVIFFGKKSLCALFTDRFEIIGKKGEILYGTDVYGKLKCAGVHNNSIVISSSSPMSGRSSVYTADESGKCESTLVDFDILGITRNEENVYFLTARGAFSLSDDGNTKTLCEESGALGLYAFEDGGILLYFRNGIKIIGKE